jgi:hypothetical protein
MVEENVMCNNDLSLHRIPINTTEFYKISAQMLIVGNLMICYLSMCICYQKKRWKINIVKNLNKDQNKK